MPVDEPEIIGTDGTVRKAHYGVGEQPWDTIKRLGWAAQFAAGNVLKYVRRHAAKNGADDLAKARWYMTQLHALSKQSDPALVVLGQLLLEMTIAEVALLGKIT